MTTLAYVMAALGIVALVQAVRGAVRATRPW